MRSDAMPANLSNGPLSSLPLEPNPTLPPFGVQKLDPFPAEGLKNTGGIGMRETAETIG